MKKAFALIALLFAMASVNAQTAEQLVGKWKLVKWTKGGKEQDIQKKFKTTEVYQVFDANGDFTSINGDTTHNGKWSLNKDNKKLTITVGVIVSETFNIDYFDAKKRVISLALLGTLEYEKVE
jgi:hypothetical protein